MKELPKAFYINVTDENLEFLKEVTKLDYISTEHIVGKVNWKSTGPRDRWEHNNKGIISGNGYSYGEELKFEDFKK